MNNQMTLTVKMQDDKELFYTSDNAVILINIFDNFLTSKLNHVNTQ